MPTVHSQNFTRNGVEYELEVGFDDAAIMDDQLVVLAKGKRREHTHDDWQAVDAKILVHAPEGFAEVYVAEQKIGEFKLNDNRYDFSDEDDDAGETLVSQLHEDAAGVAVAFEDLVSGFPAGDPVLGCLLKGALSSAVGQIFRCYAEVNRDGDRQGIVRQMAICLGDNIWGMLWVASRRSLKCMVLLGFG